MTINSFKRRTSKLRNKKQQNRRYLSKKSILNRFVQLGGDRKELIHEWLDAFSKVVLYCYKMHGDILILQLNKNWTFLPGFSEHIQQIKNCMSDTSTPEEALSTLFWGHLQFGSEVISANMQSICDHLNDQHQFSDEHFNLADRFNFKKIFDYLRHNEYYNDMSGANLEESSMIQVMVMNMNEFINRKIKSLPWPPKQ
jgi:hypothetical protein